MKYFIVIALIVSAVTAAPGAIEEEQTNSYKPVVQYFKGCLDSSDIGTCLAVKGISILNRAARAQSIEILPGITFSKKENVELRSAKSLSENEIITTLESENGENGEKSGRLLDMALEAGSNFLNTHDIQIKVPSETTQEIAKALDEGRGKKKNKMGGMMMAAGAKMLAMLPLALLGLKLLVFKALVVSKIAFFLALMLSASKLMGGGGGFGSGILGKVGNVGSLLSSGGGSGGYGGGSTGGWSSGSGSSGWSNGGGSYKRSYDEETKDLAYNGQKPNE